MASAKQRAWNNAFGAFVKKHGRAPRKGEIRASSAGKATKKGTRMPNIKQAASKGRSAGSTFRGKPAPILKDAIDGALIAAGRRVGAYVSPTFGPAAATAAVGMYRRNSTATTLGVAEVAGRLIDAVAIPTLPMGSNLNL